MKKSLQDVEGWLFKAFHSSLFRAKILHDHDTYENMEIEN